MNPARHGRPATLLTAVRSLVAATCLLAAASPALSQQQDPDPPLTGHLHPDGAASALVPSRESSGTSWLPGATPMDGFHCQAGGWALMAHGQAFAQFLYESAEAHRRSRQAGSINWVMGTARRQLLGGRFGLRAMASLEPWTIPGCGTG